MSLKIGELVRVKFWDHSAEIDPDPESEPALEFFAFGRVVAITPLEYRIEAWGYSCPKEERKGSSRNRTVFSIIRSTVTEIKRLRIAKS